MRVFLTIAFCVFLSSCASTPHRDLSRAPEGSQSLAMWHKPSNERLNVVYRANGRYVPEAFATIDRFFRDRNTGTAGAISPALIEAIVDLRNKMVLPPDVEIELTSGFRSAATNARLKNAAKNSYHMKGMAADIRLPDMNSRVLELVAQTMQKGGVALYPDSGHVHVDVGPVRGWEVKKGRE